MEDEVTLNLEVWSDELSPSQLSVYESTQAEIVRVKKTLTDLLGTHGGAEIFSSDQFSAFEILGDIPRIQLQSSALVKSTYKPYERSPKPGKSPRKRVINYKEDDDDEEDVPLVKRITKAKEKENIIPKKETVKEKKLKAAKVPEKKHTATTVRPSETSSIGGLTIGIAKKPEPGKFGPDSKEVSFNKLQGKTFPSLVVLARPSLTAKDPSNLERSALDSKVKIVLMLTPAKFTEWLIQQGLLKAAQKCALHTYQELKLGVYSDGTKFPYSGGYVWISECCPTRFVSVFHGSLFEGAPHPPSYILKLIYHWSCQTNVANVVQWVKVDNVYIKGVYTWLRAICTVALSKNFKLMGGSGKQIEVGVISLGTTTQDGQQRQVKVEVLGVLDHAAKIIRLRAIEPCSESERTYKKRFAKILQPVTEWVHKDSTIITDLTVDRSTLISLGYQNVVQVASNDLTAKHSNFNVMDYLRKIVPRMFQNTLSLLSRQMIQQFLDELAWREQYGTFPLQTFENITKHIAEETKMETKETLINRLYKIATNPFKNWAEYDEPVEDVTAVLTPKRAAGRSKFSKDSPSHDNEKPSKKSSEDVKPKRSSDTAKQKAQHRKIEADSGSDDTVGFEEYYYGRIESDPKKLLRCPDFLGKCPECQQYFATNTELQNHIFLHVSNAQNEDSQCKSCLEKRPTVEALKKHVEQVHPVETKSPFSSTFNCVICEMRLNSFQILLAHMQKTHVGQELPYKCSGCNYRSSSHRNVIDHFYKDHQESDILQCPFCLMLFRVYANGDALDQNVEDFYNHLKKHHSKSQAKKCTKCCLSFISKGPLKVHIMFDHQSSSGKSRIGKYVENSSYIPVPKVKYQSHRESNAYKCVTAFNDLVMPEDDGKICLECDTDFSEDHHLTGVLKCQKCRYKTCCLRAMLEHTSSCQSGVNPESNVHINLDNEMHCVCGFSTSEGNSMARHLAVCEHKSAYPSLEAAQENTVKRNMLDMLGLVRRGEDAAETVEIAKPEN